MVLGFPLALLLYKLFFTNDKSFLAISVGLVFVLFATLFHEMALTMFPPLLLGLGLGLVAPEFLLLFVKLSHHCQRGTANHPHFFSGSMAISSGIASASPLESCNQIV